MNYTTLEIDIPKDELDLLNQAVEVSGVSMDQFVSDALWQTLYAELEERHRELIEVFKTLKDVLRGKDLSMNKIEGALDIIEKVLEEGTRDE